MSSCLGAGAGAEKALVSFVDDSELGGVASALEERTRIQNPLDDGGSALRSGR